MRSKLETQAQRWVDAGLIDSQAAQRILNFEASQEKHSSLRWPVFLALAFGGILLAAGVTLFVAAHWNEMSPASRFSTVLLMVAVFQVGGALTSERFPALSTTLHGIGTATLGAAIFLTAQIFNLHENWPTGVLLWAMGATAGYALLRDWVQATALGLLVPSWLIGQWAVTAGNHSNGNRPLAFGLIMTAISYLSARAFDDTSVLRRAFVWIGGLALLPCAATAIALAMTDGFDGYRTLSRVSSGTLAFGWVIAVLAPLGFAAVLRKREAWPLAAWGIWTYLLLVASSKTEAYHGGTYTRSLVATSAMYLLFALGSVGLVAWGLYEKRRDRVNLGVAAFAIAVLFFYFDNFMGKIGRSTSLVALGLICLAGGYALEVTRRKLMARMEIVA